jgi:hypothetical protein
MVGLRTSSGMARDLQPPTDHPSQHVFQRGTDRLTADLRVMRPEVSVAHPPKLALTSFLWLYFCPAGAAEGAWPIMLRRYVIAG